MDVNDGIWEGFKYLWQVVAAALSAALSYVMYRHKQQNERIKDMEDEVQETGVLIRVFEERLTNIIKDIEEIKSDIKKVLFNQRS